MDKQIKIALAGNLTAARQHCSMLTGSNQFVGNWPGVTVEKEGRLKKHDDVVIMDLPVLTPSPYTLEERRANIIDGTNLERNLYSRLSSPSWASPVSSPST